MYSVEHNNNSAVLLSPLVTGTPGVGKSIWQFYAFKRVLELGMQQPSSSAAAQQQQPSTSAAVQQQQSNTPAIVWETAYMPNQRVLFKDGKGLVGDTTSFKAELGLSSTW